MEQNYTHTPQYKKHGYDEDVLYVLVCQIKVWKATAPNWFEIPEKCTVITEVEEIEINETYRELINGAVIKLPKGAVISETITNKKVDDEVKTGNMTDQDVEKKLSESSRLGELLVVADMISESDEHTLLIDNTKSDTGLAPDADNKQRVATQNDFQTGNRIQIQLGYVYQPKDGEDIITEKLEKVKKGEDIPEFYLAFTGFITGCSVSSPLEIECENMASILKKKSCKKGVYKGKYTVNDFLKSGGKYDLLADTGISLSEVTQSIDISISNFEITDNLSVADLLFSWKKGGLHSMISRDGKEIKVGSFSVSDTKWQSDKTHIGYTDNKSIQYIQSDWDVVSDNLEVTKVDKEFIVINAKGRDENGKDFRVMVGKVNGEFHHEKHDYKIRKKQKRKKGQSDKPVVVSKFDTKKYTIVQYEPHGITTMDALITAAEEYWDSYNPNGISGNLVVFGDLRIAPTQIVGIVNPWAPEKNGNYFVESVKTSFGVNGFRQTIKIPYKMSDFTKPIKVIE